MGNKIGKTKARPVNDIYFVIFTIVSKKLPPYFSSASFIFKNP
jgi:hypothetical protein